MAMMMAFLAVAMVAPAPDAIGPQSCRGGDAASCTFIVGAERALTHMLLTADPAPLVTYLDDRAVWALPDGIAKTKPEMIAAIRRDVPKASARQDALTVTFFGNVAIANWAESWVDAGADATPGRAVGTDTWVRRDGTWKIVALQEGRPNP